MIIGVVIILVVAIGLLWLWKKNKTDFNSKSTLPKPNKIDVVEKVISEDPEVFIDELGKSYFWVEKSREVPRKTYIKADFYGKYWGIIDDPFTNQFEHFKFYDFSFYEVVLKNAIYNDNENEPFELDNIYNIPREKLPKLIHTILEKDGKEYEVNLYEPLFNLKKFKSNRKLHQDDGNEVFGTIETEVVGYILDFKNEIFFEKQYLIEEVISNPVSKPDAEIPKIHKLNIPTGNIEIDRNEKRIEYFYSDYKNTYWGPWKRDKLIGSNSGLGCLSILAGIFAAIFWIGFLLMVLPQMMLLVPFFLLLLLLNLISTRFLGLIFRFLGFLILIGFIITLFQFFRNTTTFISPPRTSYLEDPQEKIIKKRVTTGNVPLTYDTLIYHYRVWNDYDGKKFEGEIWTKKSDYFQSQYFKNNLNFNIYDENSYDKIIYHIKENDKNKLNGVYQLFDSIKKKESLNKIKFAEMIVSFVQDIPYSVVVPLDCNPKLYDDEFLKNYLGSSNARCDGFAKFGINSPVEFMTRLHGDCDTRTLLLYTIFAHYDYDVALFSSEFYRHSILGINLPLKGTYYPYENQRYFLWETTAPNIKAGILPKEISNLKYWRISLKSK